jgi:hypothetical protein
MVGACRSAVHRPGGLLLLKNFHTAFCRLVIIVLEQSSLPTLISFSQQVVLAPSLLAIAACRYNNIPWYWHWHYDRKCFGMLNGH